MQKNNRVLGGGLDVLKHTADVEAVGVLVKVSVLFQLETRVLHDRNVVAPGGVGDVDLLGVGVELVQEGSADAEGTGT